MRSYPELGREAEVLVEGHEKEGTHRGTDGWRPWKNREGEQAWRDEWSWLD